MSTLEPATRGDLNQPDEAAAGESPPARLAAAEIPDTHSQFEDMLGEVWRAEANWRLDDRLDLAMLAERRAQRPPPV